MTNAVAGTVENPGAWLDADPGARSTAVAVGARAVRKTVYTLAVNNYAPAIRRITMPLLESWCEKIGAELYVISERRFPDAPPVYEKLQIFELGKRHGNDWNIFVDADALIHPDMYDPTLLVGKDTIAHNGTDPAPVRWTYDHYFRRDGRHIGSCNWFAMASDWCLDLWRPLDDISIEEAVKRINVTLNEQNSGLEPSHLIDDFTLSRNIARFGLKVTTIAAINKALFNTDGGYFWHAYAVPEEKKIAMMKDVLKQWKVV